MLCKKAKRLQLQSFGGVCAAGADGQRMRDERQTSGAAGRLRCRTVCAEQKNKAADGSLVSYLYLVLYTLSSPVFSGLGDFWGEKSSRGVWGEAP